jgi:hypothetical protein
MLVVAPQLSCSDDDAPAIRAALIEVGEGTPSIVRPLDSLREPINGAAATRNGILAVTWSGAVYRVTASGTECLSPPLPPDDFESRFGSVVAYLPDEDGLLLMSGRITSDTSDRRLRQIWAFVGGKWKRVPGKGKVPSVYFGGHSVWWPGRSTLVVLEYDQVWELRDKVWFEYDTPSFYGKQFFTLRPRTSTPLLVTDDGAYEYQSEGRWTKVAHIEPSQQARVMCQRAGTNQILALGLLTPNHGMATTLSTLTLD